MSSHSVWVHGAERSAITVVDHAVSVSFAAQSVLIVSTVAAHHIVLLLSLLDEVVIL